jgi:predicted ATPase
VYFVSLAALTDAKLTIPTIAQTLGLRERPNEPLLETLIDHLRGKRMLLVLDNMEQITGAASEIARLALETETLKMLVTSRAPLQIAVEQLYPVPALHLPELADLPDLDTLSQYEAIRLFLARAQAADPEFAITNDNAPAIAEICVRVDGLPLAVELAAARVSVLSPQAMLARLDQRLTLLISGRHDQDARQRTLRATIAWSYDLLSSDERLLFMRLGAFVGGSRIDAAAAVCDPDGSLDFDVLDGLASLVEKSLLRKRDDPDGEPRFWMLETIHEYARERLEASSELEATLERHTAHYSRWLLDAAPLMPVPYDRMGGRLVAQEHLNLRALLQRLESHDRDEELLQIVACIWWSMYFRGLISEARTWLERAVRGRGSDLRWRALALAGIVNCAARQGDLDAAVVAADAELSVAEQLGDDTILVSAWRDLALARSFSGELEAGEECLRQSIQIAERVGDRYGLSAGLNNLAHIALARGEYRHAIEITSEATIFANEVGDSYQQAICAYNIGSALLRLGEIGDAERHFATALELVLDLDFLEGIAYPLSALAVTAAHCADWERAVRLFGAAAALTDRAGLVFDPLEQSERERALEQARSHLGAADYDERYVAGRALLTNRAIAEALRRA